MRVCAIRFTNAIKRAITSPIFLILVLALILRLPNISAPFSGHHSWKEVQNAGMAYRFIEEGDFFTPRSFENPPNNDAVPFSAWLVVGFWRLFGSSEWAARLPFLIFGLATVYTLYLIGKLLYGKKTGLYAGFFLAISPMHVYFSRNVQIESILLLFMALSAYFFLKWDSTNRAKYFYWSVIFLSLATLSKYIALFLLFPYAVHVLIHRKRLDAAKLIFGVVTIFLPVALWILHTSKFPGVVWGSYLFGSLSSITNTHHSVVESLMLAGGLGPLTSVFVLLAILFGRLRKSNGFPFFWFLGGLAYILGVFPAAIANNYYLMPLLPPLSLLAALGFEIALSKLKQVKPVYLLFLALITAVPLIYVLYSVRYPYYEAGTYIGAHTSPDEVIGWTESPAICFYAKRICIVWSVEQFKKNNVRYFAVTRNDWQGMGQEFRDYLKENYLIETTIYGKTNIIGRDFAFKKVPEEIRIYRRIGPA